MSITLQQAWAKTEPFQSVWTHSVITGVVAQEVLEHVLSQGSREELARVLCCSEEALRGLVGYIAALHDIGKLNAHFQAGWKDMAEHMAQKGLFPVIPGAVRHEITSYTIMKRIWRQCDVSPNALFFYGGILRAHHQGRFGEGGRTGDGVWKDLQEELEREMRRIFLRSEGVVLPDPPKRDKGAVGALLLGVVILADWIASGALFQDAESWLGPSGTVEVRRRAREFLFDSGLEPVPEDFGDGFTDVWPEIPREGMRELQRSVEEIFAQEGKERIVAMLVEAPMGEGKTEAGIYAALQMGKQWHKNGFYVALPTAATSNQMVTRVRALLERHKCEETVRLLHSMAWLTDTVSAGINSEETEYAAGWLQPTRRGLLGQFAVGTVDQAMMAVLLVKYGVLRLLGLSGKALVIDELHAYDVYMSEILTLLLQWCRVLEIPVVMLSATLPPEKKQQMLSVYTSDAVPQAYPSITWVSERGRVRTIKIQSSAKRWKLRVNTMPILHDSVAVARAAVDRVSDGGCLCVLMNTVDAAQKVYSAIQEVGFEGILLLFHARFPTRQRDEIERECIRLFGKEKNFRPAKAILVATQVVEQSLDVDFDAMFTAIAPIDLLLQRAGRIHRHVFSLRPEKLAVPTLTVLTPALEGEYEADGFVYPDCLLNSSYRLLSGIHAIAIPEDMPALVEKGYDPSAASPEEFQRWAEHLMENEVKAAMSIQYEIGPPDQGYTPIQDVGELRFDDIEGTSYLSAKTRFGEPSIRVVLLTADAFDAYAKRAVKRDSIYLLSAVSQQEARELMLDSVSVRWKLLGRVPPEKVLEGGGLLSGLRIYLAEVDERGRRVLTVQNETKLILDKALGVIWKRGENNETKF